MWRRVLALWCWSILIWTLLSWTATVEQVAVGIAVSLVVALACAPLGPVAGPWVLLYPRRIVPLLALAVAVSGRVVAANWHLSRVIAPGLLLMWRYGSRAHRALPRLALIATGSVNDYASYLAAGTVAVCLVMTL
jgi:hypothetical protein